MPELCHNRLRTIALTLIAFTFWTGIATEISAQKQGAPVRDANLTFQRPVSTWKSMRQKNIVMQKRDFSCGAAVLATIMQFYWNDTITEEVLIRDMEKMLTPEEIKERIKIGLAMTDLRKLAVRNGYLSTIGRLSFQKLTKTKIPLIVGIVHNGYDHFVIYRGFDGEWVYLADPARGNIRIPVSVFVKEWQKNMVLIVAKKGSKPRKSSPLDVTYQEKAVGQTNFQMIKTLPSNVIHKPAFRGP